MQSLDVGANHEALARCKRSNTPESAAGTSEIRNGRERRLKSTAKPTLIAIDESDSGESLVLGGGDGVPMPCLLALLLFFFFQKTTTTTTTNRMRVCVWQSRSACLFCCSRRACATNQTQPNKQKKSESKQPGVASGLWSCILRGSSLRAV